MNTLAKSFVVTIMAASLGACMFHGGGAKHVSTTTVGQELSDLKLALDNGAITESEYKAIKEQLINSKHADGHHSRHAP